MQRGEVKRDLRLLRKVAALCQRLPAASTPDFRDAFAQLRNDTLLVTYLATMTKVQPHAHRCQATRLIRPL